MANTAESKLTKSQKKVVWSPDYRDGERDYQLFRSKIELRFDDECGNGHNTFAITADVYLCDVKGNRVRWESGGCCHDEIVKAMPEYAKFIKWHLCSTDEARLPGLLAEFRAAMEELGFTW